MSSRDKISAGRGRHEAPAAAEDRGRETKKKSALGTVLLVIMMLVGIGVMAYPSISNWWNGRHASRAVASYSQDVSAIDSTEPAPESIRPACGAWPIEVAMPWVPV